MTVITAFLLAGGNITFIESVPWEDVYRNRVRWGDLKGDEWGIAYAASWDRAEIGNLLTVYCPSGLVLEPVLVIDCASERDHEYLRSIDFRLDVFGKDVWERCAIPGRTAQVEVHRYVGRGVMME